MGQSSVASDLLSACFSGLGLRKEGVEMEPIATIRRRRRKGGTVEWIARLVYEEAGTGRRKELSRSAPSPKEARRRLQELEDDFTERGVAAIGADQMKFSALVTHCKEKRYCEPIYDSEGRKLARRNAPERICPRHWLMRAACIC